MKKTKTLTFAAVLVAGLAAVFMSSRAPASTVDAPFEGKPEVVAATFASAWCSSCKILKPRLAKVVPQFKDAPVKFVEYDFTFGERDGTREAAEADGLAAVYDRYAKATGFTVLVDADSGDIIDTLTINHSSTAMRAAIAQALAVASVTPAISSAS